jgi:hypothetical protein
MPKKNDLVKRLRNDELYTQALGRARTLKEREIIANFVEGFVNKVDEVMAPLIERAKRDPEFAKQLVKAMSEGKGLLTGGQSSVSGSNA